jgi:hypothetical protein
MVGIWRRGGVAISPLLLSSDLSYFRKVNDTTSPTQPLHIPTHSIDLQTLLCGHRTSLVLFSQTTQGLDSAGCGMRAAGSGVTTPRILTRSGAFRVALRLRYGSCRAYRENRLLDRFRLAPRSGSLQSHENRLLLSLGLYSVKCSIFQGHLPAWY